MSAIITSKLVKRYIRATGPRMLAAACPSDPESLDAFVFDLGIDRAALGMLAAAEMVHERAALAKCDRPERAVFHELTALERSFVSAAGVDFAAWTKARGA